MCYITFTLPATQACVTNVTLEDLSIDTIARMKARRKKEEREIPSRKQGTYKPWYRWQVYMEGPHKGRQ